MTSRADRVARIRGLVGAFNRHDVARSVEHLVATVAWSRGDGTLLQGRDPTGRAVRAVGAALFGFNPAGEIASDAPWDRRMVEAFESIAPRPLSIGQVPS